jgi:hypothetical protein
MKKKNLIILLIFPFLISTFCIVTVNTTYNKIDVDISYIDWEYNDVEAFQISSSSYPLVASGVNQRYYKVSDNNALVWQVENKHATDTEPCAEVYESGGKHYLKALRSGEVIVTCSNLKGNVYRQMTAIIYKDAAILLYPTVGSSQTNIDPTIYYGEYDHNRGTAAEIEMSLTVVPASASEELVVDCTDNITFDQKTGTIHVVGTGKARLTLSHPKGLAEAKSFEFEIVDEGVNVYTYEDLLNCTNRSKQGEIVVLRKSFESIYNAYVTDANGAPVTLNGNYQLKSNNVECFGNYDPKTKKFSFADEIYSFTTTYNKSFIEQWNEFSKTNSNYSEISDKINVGLRIQKDFYGNGYTLNLHNLVYPYSYVLMTTDSGETVRIPQLTNDNLFRGPLKLYSLGDPNNMPLVSLYGQDNVGLYVDGDDITVNDVNVKNCEFGDRLANLATTGTVLEVSGNGNTVKNSRLSNGKNVVRSFSSKDFTLENCMLSHSQNFLFVTGSNEYVPVDTEAMASFSMLDGSTQQKIIGEFMAPEADGDAIVNQFMMSFSSTSEEKTRMRQALLSIQSALNNASAVQGNFKGNTEIVDCFFYQSGIASICMESLFNSSFLEMASPSMITEIFSMLESSGMSLVPYTATKTTGISYPVKLNISGDTRFYDYKTADDIALDGLIEENISAVANSVGLADLQITIDMIFPLKSMLMQKAANQGSQYYDAESGKRYVNVPVAFYGGGLNLSEVTFQNYENISNISGEVEVDLLDTYLNLSGSSGTSSLLRGIMLKTVITVSGFEPFSFRFTKNGYLYGETPKVTDLIANAKEIIS